MGLKGTNRVDSGGKAVKIPPSTFKFRQPAELIALSRSASQILRKFLFENPVEAP